MRFYLRCISYFRRDWPLVLVFLALIGVSIVIGVMQAWADGGCSSTPS